MLDLNVPAPAGNEAASDNRGATVFVEATKLLAQSLNLAGSPGCRGIWTDGEEVGESRDPEPIRSLVSSPRPRLCLQNGESNPGPVRRSFQFGQSTPQRGIEPHTCTLTAPRNELCDRESRSTRSADRGRPWCVMWLDRAGMHVPFEKVLFRK